MLLWCCWSVFTRLNWFKYESHQFTEQRKKREDRCSALMDRGTHSLYNPNRWSNIVHIQPSPTFASFNSPPSSSRTPLTRWPVPSQSQSLALTQPLDDEEESPSSVLDMTRTQLEDSPASPELHRTPPKKEPLEATRADNASAETKRQKIVHKIIDDPPPKKEEEDEVTIFTVVIVHRLIEYYRLIIVWSAWILSQTKGLTRSAVLNVDIYLDINV